MKLIRLAAENMNSVPSQKYGHPPNVIEETALKSEWFKEIYDFIDL